MSVEYNRDILESLITNTAGEAEDALMRLEEHARTNVDRVRGYVRESRDLWGYDPDDPNPPAIQALIDRADRAHASIDRALQALRDGSLADFT
ncbi:MAG: hypothetical protein F4Z60_06870 [Chloroflexi bacterium]|nr:hypothetical protein [Chloroflexota bacterium]